MTSGFDNVAVTLPGPTTSIYIITSCFINNTTSTVGFAYLQDSAGFTMSAINLASTNPNNFIINRSPIFLLNNSINFLINAFTSDVVSFHISYQTISNTNPLFAKFGRSKVSIAGTANSTIQASGQSINVKSIYMTGLGGNITTPLKLTTTGTLIFNLTGNNVANQYTSVVMNPQPIKLSATSSLSITQTTTSQANYYVSYTAE